MDFVRSHFRKMNLWPVEHFFEHICHDFWVGLLLHPPMTNMLKKVFNGSEVHLSYFLTLEIKSKDAKAVKTSNQVWKTNTSITRNSGRNWRLYIILDKKNKTEKGFRLKGCAMNDKSFRLCFWLLHYLKLLLF